jgi:hypothetical protein
MSQYANPLDHVLQCVEIGLVPYQFDINNAKDELKKLRQELDHYRSMTPVAWGKMNSRGDLYDLRTQDNPYTPETNCVPLYSNKVEFKDFYAKYKNK